MSIQAVAWVLESSEAVGCDRLVLIAIANHIGATGWAWPSIPAIAHEARVDARTVYRAIDTLEESGELTIRRRPGKSSIYGLAALLSGVTDCQGSGVTQGVATRHKGVATRQGTPGTSPPESLRTIKEPRTHAREDERVWSGETLDTETRKRGAEFFRALRKGETPKVLTDDEKWEAFCKEEWSK